MHAVHHPDRLRPAHDWVDWFTEFKASDRGKPVGLEFQEGLWAEKFAIIAILITIAIIIVSIVWVVRGGQLQTVFTVMGFVLSGAAGKHFATAGLIGYNTDAYNSRVGSGGAVFSSDHVELNNNILATVILISCTCNLQSRAVPGKSCSLTIMSANTMKEKRKSSGKQANQPTADIIKEPTTSKANVVNKSP